MVPRRGRSRGASRRASHGAQSRRMGSESGAGRRLRLRRESNKERRREREKERKREGGSVRCDKRRNRWKHFLSFSPCCLLSFLDRILTQIRPLRRSIDWQQEPERAPLPIDRLHADLATVHLHKALAEGEAE